MEEAYPVFFTQIPHQIQLWWETTDPMPGSAWSFPCGESEYTRDTTTWD